MAVDPNTLLVWVISCADRIRERPLVDQLTHAVDRRQTVQGFVQAVPVVAVNLGRKLIAKVGRRGVGGRPKFFQHRSLDPLHFAIQMRRAGADGTEPNGLPRQPALNLLGKKFGAAVGL